MTPTSVLVVVPTTGGPVVLRSLRSRPGLPASAAFAAGDYRPLPWSGDYARLAAAGGPLSRLADVDAGPYELRLSGSFDAGRSWEVPVCLAHGLVARGYALTTEPEAADLVLWATGAVDLDLAVLPGDYALLDKVARSRDLLATAERADLAVLLPEGPETEEAERAFGALGRARPPVLLPGADVPGALATLLRPVPPAVPTARRHPRMLAGLAVLAAASILAGGAAALRPRPEAERPAVDDAGTASVEPRPAVAPAPASAVVVEELIAPAGSSCRRVAFGAEAPVRRLVPREAQGRLRASRLAPDLCGVAIRPASPGPRIAVGPELTGAALPPTRLPDGAEAYFLRENGRRHLVYAVQAIPDPAKPEADASPAGERLTHALTP
ncbi:hypothetical protein [Methylobacterium nonmethylotrophicum]|uniref:Uncharacterized protein n=1 Tax=Methylobacterium nonmethylotrophicum TaxID=1141884 RepID=A0A4Z0NW96_9HYPH|nr:hypothetical protein [Methylobacterium nonmethylotrophicum]TGE01748.1 hypothetical protein EU555_03485 [Methylobacterium nonmethylotrophicum]